MMKKFLLLLVLFGPAGAGAGIDVKTVDFLRVPDVAINAAGPLLIQMDEDRNRLIVANTLSSSVSIIDCQTRSVKNVPLAGRVLQHLKSEALTLNRRTGEVCLIGTNCLYIISPENKTSETVETDVQFESIAVDDETGNVFLAGRESKSLGFYEAKTRTLKRIKWLDRRENLINLNATPPPPIRKVVVDKGLRKVIAVDGFTSTLYLFAAKNGKLMESRELQLTAGGRWHLAGYDEVDHCLYLVVETDERKVVEAARIDAAHMNDVIVQLPQFTEGVGINYNPMRKEVYIPYDNHPSVHVASFEDGGKVEEIKVPAYGNDASAIDLKNDLLFVASWAFGEIDIIDLCQKKLKKRVTGLGIIPHMFTIAYNPKDNLIYFPKGATAVNGTFGAALTALDPVREQTSKIYIGWAPVDLIELKKRNSFLVFNSEDKFAEVHPDGSYEIYDLPYDYPIRAIHGPGGDVYLSYGPHQSYWPTVYIWGAKNGILTIDAENFSFYDRRIPRQAHAMALDREGVLHFTQNNWGREEQFLGTLEDQVRVFEANKRLALVDEVEREITQRILRYDSEKDLLYLVRLGEKDEDPSLLQVIDQRGKKVIQKVTLGLTASDMVFDDYKIYAANFDSRSISVIDKSSFEASEVETGDKPLKLCRWEDRVYVITHLSNTLQEVKEKGKIHKIPFKGLPDNLLAWNDKLIITSHSRERLFIIQFDPNTESFELLHEQQYPYGDTRFDSRNVSFYVRGQFGDAIFDITKGKTSKDGKLWIIDFLSGRLVILSEN